jgi:hypothetical protein
MNCREVEKRIYLYRELNDAERKQADEHITQCESCRALAAQAFHHQELIKKVRPMRAVVNNPEWLTQQIMNSVERREKRVSLFDGIATLLDSLFVRYAFSVASLLLILFFAVEQQRPDYTPPVAEIKTEKQQGPVLDMSKVLSAYLQRRESKEPAPSIARFTYYKSERAEKNYKQ